MDQHQVTFRSNFLSSHFSKGKQNQPIERIIPGREFHGTVVSSKCPKFEVGDNVVGLKHPTETFGTLSEYVSSSGTFILLIK